MINYMDNHSDELNNISLAPPSAKLNSMYDLVVNKNLSKILEQELNITFRKYKGIDNKETYKQVGTSLTLMAESTEQLAKTGCKGLESELVGNLYQKSFLESSGILVSLRY